MLPPLALWSSNVVPAYQVSHLSDYCCNQGLYNSGHCEILEIFWNCISPGKTLTSNFISLQMLTDY